MKIDIILFLLLITTYSSAQQQNLTAKQVPVEIRITHNIAPPNYLPPCKVSIVCIKTKALLIAPKKISPGRYNLHFTQPGYNKIIRIAQVLEKQDLFIIEEKLIAKKRGISFEGFASLNIGCVGGTDKIVNLENQQQIDFYDKFQPGKKLKLRYKFRHYQHVDIDMIIVPGVGPQRIHPVQLLQLKTIEFSINQNHQIINNIKYSYEFTVDGNKPDDLHIREEHGIGRFYYSLKLLPKAKIFRAYAGFRYTQIELSKFRLGQNISNFGNISISRLVQHLKKITKIQDRFNALEKLLMNKNDKLFEKIESSEIKILTGYLKVWEQELPSKYHVRLNVIVNIIDRIAAFLNQ